MRAERHVAHHRASPCWARSVSALGKERLVAHVHYCSCCSVAVVAVLQKLFTYPKNTSIFIYINIELNFDFRTIYFGTATTATLQQRVQSDSRDRYR